MTYPAPEGFKIVLSRDVPAGRWFKAALDTPLRLVEEADVEWFTQNPERGKFPVFVKAEPVMVEVEADVLETLIRDATRLCLGSDVDMRDKALQRVFEARRAAGQPTLHK